MWQNKFWARRELTHFFLASALVLFLLEIREQKDIDVVRWLAESIKSRLLTTTHINGHLEWCFRRFQMTHIPFSIFVAVFPIFQFCSVTFKYISLRHVTICAQPQMEEWAGDRL